MWHRGQIDWRADQGGPTGVTLTLGSEYLEALVGGIEQLRAATSTTVSALRRTAEKAEWVASARMGGGEFGRYQARRGYVRRHWTLERRCTVKDPIAEDGLVMEFDASPWENGGVLYTRGVQGRRGEVQHQDGRSPGSSTARDAGNLHRGETVGVNSTQGVVGRAALKLRSHWHFGT